MIYIDREATDENGTPIRPNNAWFDSAAIATEAAIREKDQHEVDTTIYRHSEVRIALERLFHDKCAYCEWKPTGGSDWDVEHFRPKGRVAEREDHLGYYWLAYAWSNLYPSCTHCNQNRKDKLRWGDPAELPAAGKRDQFPLHDETTRVMSHEDNDKLLHEHTLVIDPCYDDPEDYIGFDLTGQAFSLDDNPYGETTINVFNLKRRRLRDLRRAKVQSTVIILKLARKHEKDGNAAIAHDIRALLDNEQADAAQFAAVVRCIIRDPEAFGVA